MGDKVLGLDELGKKLKKPPQAKDALLKLLTVRAHLGRIGLVTALWSVGTEVLPVSCVKQLR